jgi:two-component system, cell cycle sensor histidine kinase and response regulator CckA
VSADPARPAVPEAPSRALPRRGRVLIVDDNADLVGALRDVLLGADLTDGRAAPHRVEVTSASRGEEGLAVAREKGFDVAIVDVLLPDASGVDLIQPLREASPFSEVLLITGFASIDAAMGALRSGAFAFLPKSFRPEELLATVEQALNKVRLKREREEFERRYRALVELTDVLVVGLDGRDTVGLFNRKAAALAGVARADALGRDFLAGWIPAADESKMREALGKARAGDRACEVETGFLTGGEARRVRWSLSSARDTTAHTQADPGLVYGIGIDVTERRALEKRAADAEAMSAMAALALNLAHEIRNPLNAAVLQLHLLERHIDKLDADEQARHTMRKKAKIVEGEIGRLNRLLTEFLDLARPRGIRLEPVHMGRLVEDVLDLEQGSAAARGVRIERDVAHDGCVAFADAEKLKQVVLNLVVNALEAMKEGGTLTARVACEGASRVLVAIEDTGPGIEPAFLGKVFDPFFTTKEGGTGLGLSIVRKIVDQHEGEVRIETERGAGTRVRVFIPRGR